MPETVDALAAPQAYAQADRVIGVTVALVVDNVDSQRLGRVQLSLPWLPDYEPWARVAVLSAGSSRGTWFIPQIGDEVLVAFEQGDIRAPYVVGSLWNGSDKPPADSPLDPVARRIVKTPAGHTIELDDTKQSITIETSTQQKISITPEKIELSAGNGASTVTLETAGSISLQATTKLSLQAPELELSGTNVKVSGDAAADVEAGGTLTLQGGLVRIN